MKLNLKKVQDNSGDGGYAPITEGRYDLVVESGQQKTAKSGNQYIEFTLKVLGPDFVNRKVWANLSLLENAQIYLVRFLEAAGKADIIEDGVEVSDIIRAAVGQKVSGYIKQRKNQRSGNITNSVENFTEPMGVESDETGGSSGSPSASEESSGEQKSTKSKLFG